LTNEVDGAALDDMEDELHVNADWLTATAAAGDDTDRALGEGADAALGLVTDPAGKAPVG
jgi:hypothetical protein